MRVCIAGGGLAGSLLAWRLAQLGRTEIDLLTGAERDQERGQGPGMDATAASGGAVRGYDSLPEQRGLAIASMAELLASPVLRDWARYRETGFAYLPVVDTGRALADVATAVADIERELPGSAELTSPAQAFGAGGEGFADLLGSEPAWAGSHATVVVVERKAGYTSPASLRDAVLADLTRRPGVRILPAPLITTKDSGYDAVVVAAGAWTPGLLRARGLPADEYRTRSIQYTVYDCGPWRPPPFADERTGLYGMPTADDGLLLGVSTTEWGVPPGVTPVTRYWHERALRVASGCFPRLKLGRARRQVSAADCFAAPPVLRLRQASGRWFTFTGGSGGCAKSVLAASRRAAAALKEATGDG